MMAYFDSAKNRAIWERELAGLRTERERRRANGFRPEARNMQAVKSASDENPFRRRINLAELERIELMASGARRVARPRRRNMDRAREMASALEQPKAQDTGVILPGLRS